MTETEAKVYDFKDGNGPVPAHRHINGGGWVADTAQVSGNARVYGNAQVSDTARVYGNAQVSGNARVYGNAQVSGNARVYGNAQVVSETGKGLNGATFSCGQFTVTVNDDRIQIGCENKTVTEWLAVSQRDAIKMGLDRHLYGQYMAFIRMVADYQAKAMEASK